MHYLARSSSRVLHSRLRLHRPAVAVLTREINIGILRESYDKWERRVALTPDHVAELTRAFKGGSQIIVQPSQRIFPDSQYEKAGAKVQDDVSSCDLLLGVKRVANEDDLLSNKTYMFFSHVIKGQQENMPLLQTVLDRNIELIDYESILDRRTGKRAVAFGRYAGIAGMIDTFQCLGRRLLASGYSTPFLNCATSYIYKDLADARTRVSELGSRIESGLPSMGPLVFAFTGNGNVTNGALEIFKLLPHKMISLEEAKALRSSVGPQNFVYGLMVGQSDIVRRIGGEGMECEEFDKKHYRCNPSEYESTFATEVAPYCNVIVNGMYWDERYPRLLTKKEMSELYRKNKSLYAVGDISCDVNGSIEFLCKTTTIDKPFFSWCPETDQASDDIQNNTVALMGVDILPTELSVESSQHFSEALLPLLKEFIENEKLPRELEDAVIARDGALQVNFKYIETLKRAGSMSQSQPKEDSHVLLRIKGHLFDSGLINQIFDVIENEGCHFEVDQCEVKPTTRDGVAYPTVMMLKIFEKAEEGKIDRVLSKVGMLLDVIDNAEASMQHYDNRRISDQTSVRIAGEDETVLLLGAGMVAASFAEYLGRSKSTKLVVASLCETEALEVAQEATRGKAVKCDLSRPSDRLRHLIDDADVVVSLLPAHLHPMIAKECVDLRTNLVTASYESEEMKSMNAAFEEAGISVLNEVGLDPGMDHMSAMRIIDDIKSRGGEVTSFSSVCGGLPAPESANNPLGYKFSWSPRGVITASSNAALYRDDGQLVFVEGGDLLINAKPFKGFHSLNLECLPNRDSVKYGSKYGIESASTIFRGTLRYAGFSPLMHVFKRMGFFDDRDCGSSTWEQTIDMLSAENGFSNWDEFVLFCSSNDEGLASNVKECIRWLGLRDSQMTLRRPSIVESFCALLDEKLKYQDGERDMCLMHHDIQAIMGDGSHEHHTSSLQLYGDEKMTAMSKTVGYTVAVGTRLVLDGTVDTKGLVLPLTKQIYEPALDLLSEEGLVFKESVHVEGPQIQIQA